MQYFPQIMLKFIKKSPKIITFLNFQQFFRRFPGISPKIFKNHFANSLKHLYNYVVFFIRTFFFNFFKFPWKLHEIFTIMRTKLIQKIVPISSKLLPNFF